MTTSSTVHSSFLADSESSYFKSNGASNTNDVNKVPLPTSRIDYLPTAKRLKSKSTTQASANGKTKSKQKKTDPLPAQAKAENCYQKSKGTKKQEQYKINFICSRLVLSNVKDRKDLFENLDCILKAISEDSTIFNPNDSTSDHVDLFLLAIGEYNKNNDSNITLNKNNLTALMAALRAIRPNLSPSSQRLDDLNRVTQSYDRLETASDRINSTQAQIANLIAKNDHFICPHVILGTGDTGTTIWLEKYKNYHGQTQGKLAQGQLPDVLMIGDSFGCWKHDYTLGQPLNLLERGNAASNPSDFIGEDYYALNPHANARHIYQANRTNLGVTDAPILGETKVLKIEKKSAHEKDWKSQENNYRLIIKTSSGEKAVYTNEIDICTGLGQAKQALGKNIISDVDYQRLKQFDNSKQFAPLVDGNQYILNCTEEKSPESKTIVVYGGGGTAAASYRKAFFGHDVRTEPRAFIDPDKKNKVYLIAGRGFTAAGEGKLVTKALHAAKDRDEQRIAELREIKEDPITHRLRLTFFDAKMTTQGSTFVIECDQLVYAIGQETSELKQICSEFEAELSLNIDSTGMPLHIHTQDRQINFFGAAAMSIRMDEYSKATWDFLHKENVGPDVGPGSMPSSRAQIKKYLATKSGFAIEAINVNIDNQELMHQFFTKVGIDSATIDPLIKEILEARKDSTAGFQRGKLQDFLENYKITDKVKIQGHGHLIKK